MITAKYESYIKPAGDYEAVISKAHIEVANSGKEYISIPMTIREDVEQPCKNGKLYYTMWRRKEPTALDLEADGYSFNQIMRICEAVGIPAGTNFKDLDDILNQISWKCVVAHMEHEEYNGKKQERVKYLKKTNRPKAVAAPEYAEPAAEDEDDGDLPF